MNHVVCVSNGAEINEFGEKGYTVVRSVIGRETLDIAFRYYLSYVPVPGYFEVGGRERALDRYVDALGEAMLPRMQQRIELETGLKLLPTYSFARIYTTESQLRKHVDRGACEISATMTVGFKKAKELWPIYLESQGSSVAVELDVGDALVYRGMDLPHWREPLPEGLWCQLFFHFVDAGGSMIDHEFDGRGRLGPVWEIPRNP